MVIICHNEACPRRGSAMTCTGEYESAWTFRCSTCGARRAVTKDKVGGTRGSGQKESQGRGFVRGGFER